MREEISNDEAVRWQLLGMVAADSEMLLPKGVHFGADNWSHLQVMARQHRLEPLLYDAARRNPDSYDIPPDVQRDWEAAFRNSAMQALAYQGAIIRLATILDEAGIAYAALKGARLAWHAYAHPALRPMRDLDILVSPSRLGEVWATLISQGYIADEGSTVPANGALAIHKHLPALRDLATGIDIEVHSRLFEHLSAPHANAAMFNPDGLLASRMWLQLGQARIAYLPATEALLHLIIHSVYEHHFENGPQVLQDLTAHLKSEQVEWKRFWRLAREGGWERGCQLLLTLTERCMGAQPIEWDARPRVTIPPDVLDKAALMMLQDVELRQDLAVQVQFHTLAGSTASRAGRLLARLRVRKEVIAAYAGLATDHSGVWMHYPSWLISRLVRTLSGKINSRQREEVARAIAIESWLGGA